MAKAKITLEDGTIVSIEGNPDEVTTILKQFSGPHKKNKRNKKKNTSDKNSTPKTKRKKGQIALLNELIDEGFFTKKRTVKEIVECCSVNKATTIKSKDFASALTRFIRDDKLKREKNESGRYEYFVK